MKRTNRRVGIAALAILLVVAIVLLQRSLSPSRSDRAPPTHQTRVQLASSLDRDAADTEKPTKPLVVTLTVKDLWDHLPIENAVILARTGAPEPLRLVANADGQVTLDQAALTTLRSVESASRDHTVASKPDDIRKRREIWCYRSVVAVGRVVFENAGDIELDYGAVTLTFSPRLMGSDATPSSFPGRRAWFRDNAPPELEGSVQDDGTFRIELPRVRGAALVAHARDWSPGWANLDHSLDSPARALLLVLRRRNKLAGVLLDEHGAPVRNTTVHVFVVRRSRFDDFNADAVGRNKHSGFTAMRSRKRDLAEHCLGYTCRTDESGRWSAEVDTEGDVFVVAYPDGKTAVDRHLGELSQIVGDVRLTTRRVDHERILITKGREPQANAKYLLVDLSLESAQPNFTVRSNADGVIESTWFVPGKRYGIWPPRKGPVFFVYSGQRSIDLDACEKNFDRFMGR